MESNLQSEFERICAVPSDNNEHCLTFRALADECMRITEFGVMHGRSTISFLSANPASLVSYDIKRQKALDNIETMAQNEHIPFVFKLEDTRTATIDETDLLYIDSDHTYEQVKLELFRHGDKVRKYILLHDTTSFPEIVKAIDEFVDKGNFKVKEIFVNNNGLTVLERVRG
jgi:hypothetical protein